MFCNLYDCVAYVLQIQPHGCQNSINMTWNITWIWTRIIPPVTAYTRFKHVFSPLSPFNITACRFNCDLYDGFADGWNFLILNFPFTVVVSLLSGFDSERFWIHVTEAFDMKMLWSHLELTLMMHFWQSGLKISPSANGLLIGITSLRVHTQIYFQLQCLTLS